MPVTADRIRRWHAELAWLPGRGVRSDVLIEAAGERFTVVKYRPAASISTPACTPRPGSQASSACQRRMASGVLTSRPGR